MTSSSLSPNLQAMLDKMRGTAVEAVTESVIDLSSAMLNQTKLTLDQLSTIKDVPEPEKVILPSGTGSLPESQQVMDRITRLQESLQLNLPGYDSQLHVIHRQLSKDPELIHLLKPEQIGVVLEAMKKKKDIVLTTERSAKAGKKALSKTTLEDI